VCERAYACVRADVCACVRVCACLRADMSERVRAYVCAYVCIHIYTVGFMPLLTVRKALRHPPAPPARVFPLPDYPAHIASIIGVFFGLNSMSHIYNIGACVCVYACKHRFTAVRAHKHENGRKHAKKHKTSLYTRKCLGWVLVGTSASDARN